MAKVGRKPSLTPTQDLELWSWYQAKLAIGSFKSKAREMGLSVNILYDAIARMKKARELEQDRVHRKFMRSLRSVPF